MKLINKDLTALVIPLIILILLSEISLIGVTLINQHNTARQRALNHNITLTVLRESYSTKCLLLVPITERGQATIDRCDKEAQSKVEAVK